MKLVEATIANYKSVAAPATLELDPKITAVLGKSESGKTAILDALRRLLGDGAYSEDEQCSWRDPPGADTVMGWLTLELDSADTTSLGLDSSFRPGDRIRVGRCWDGRLQFETTLPPRSEATPVDWLASELGRLRARCRALARLLNGFRDAAPQQVDSGIARLNDVAKLLVVKDTPELQNAAVSESARGAEYVRQTLYEAIGATEESRGVRQRSSLLAADLTGLLEQETWQISEVQPVDVAAFLARLPAVDHIAGDDIELLKDDVSIIQLAVNPAGHPLMNGLLDLGELAPSDLQIANPTVRSRRLNSAQDRISDKLSSLWQQEPVRVELRVEGDVFRIELKGPEGHYGRPGQRSHGFLWFVSFYLRLQSISRASGDSGLLLLLDEPGLHLHASAQQDLLHLLEELGEGVQVVYTTHSPFLINRNFVDRIRLVEKESGGNGTRINNKPYHSESGFVWEPVRSAIGVTAGNSLFIAGSNLIVEGISDQILLAAIARLGARRTGEVLLDLDRVAIVAACGADNVVPLAHLCANCSDNAVVLLDGDDKGQRTKERLRRANAFPIEKVVLISETSPGAKTLEDLVDEALYHEAVRTAYRKLPDHPAGSELPETCAEVRKALGDGGPSQEVGPRAEVRVDSLSRATVYQKFFEKKSAASGVRGSGSKDWGDFDKVMVASCLAKRSQSNDLSDDWESTLANFQRLYEKVQRGLETPLRRPGYP